MKHVAVPTPLHLKPLRLDPVTGLPVPWAMRWIPRDGVVADENVRFDPAVKEEAVFYPDDLTGRPDWQWAPQRQRAAFVYGVCGVCRRPLDWGARNAVLSTATVEPVDMIVHYVAAVREPWVCPDCARFATHHCPEMIGRRRDGDLQIVPVEGADQCQLMMERRMPRATFGLSKPVIATAKLVLFSVDVSQRGQTPE